MILADTSAWVAYQRDTTSAASGAVRTAIDAHEIATTDLVMAEFLAGLPAPRVDTWTGLFALTTHLPHQPWDDAIEAAAIYRACRRNGFTPRSVVDCLVAAVAIRNDVPVLHDDRDYDVIARHSDLVSVRT